MRKLTWAALTDVGMKRTGNEDAFLVAEDYGVYIVCDGMGGHASGEIASQMTTEEMVAFLETYYGGDRELPYEVDEDATQPEKVLSNAVQHANDKVYVAGMRDPKLEGMGTTVTAVKDEGERLVIAHVGDSRVYRYRNNALEQLTRDHSLLNHKIDAGELTTEDEIRAFKHGNIIVRAIGLKDYVNVETQVTDRQPGDVLLLCSDGLTDLVDDWAIENVLEANQDELEEATTILVRMANDRGGKDNITVLLIRVDDEPEDEYGYDDRNFQEEATIPHGIPAIVDDEESTDPSRRGFSNQVAAYDDDDDDDDYGDFDDAPDERTAPHRPVFMWEDLGQEQGEVDDEKATMRLDKTELERIKRMRMAGGASNTSVVFDDAREASPSIIIDDD